MKFNQYNFEANVWLYPGASSWHFVSLPQELAKEIENNFRDRKRGWGSLPVIASIGNTTWKTSIFKDNKTQTYLLPLKLSVRKKENIYYNQKIKVFLEINLDT